MKLKQLFLPTVENDHTPHLLQRVAMLAMAGLVLLSFAIVNLQTLLWQNSDWLVGAVLPAVIVDLTNEEREVEDKSFLKRNAVLDEAARLKAEHMAKNEYFSHFSPDGTSPWYWFGEVSYNFAHAGENLAIHFSDSEAVVEAWMNSPLHRANIVNNNFTEIGVGTAKGKFEGYDTVYVVQLFGTPAVPALVTQPTKEETDNNRLAKRLEETEIKNEQVTDKTVNTEILGAEYKEGETEAGVIFEDKEEDAELLKEKKVAASSVVIAKTDNSNGSSDTEDEKKVTESEQVIETELEMNKSDLKVATNQTEVFSSYMATSSGLMAMETGGIVATGGTTASAIGSVAVKPNSLLQLTYLGVGLFVVFILFLSIMIGVRNHRPLQAVYGVGLLILMSGLFYVHVTLTSGVVIASELSTEKTVIE